MNVVAGWVNGTFIPLKRDAEMIADQLREGDRVILEFSFPQSDKKRGLYHAMIAEIYANLPERLANNFFDVTHFRHWLTIKAGFAIENQTICDSRAEARRLAAALTRDDHEHYSIVEFKERVVTKWTALSTSPRRMGGKQFSELVDKVLALGADMIGVAPEDLRRHTERDAHV